MFVVGNKDMVKKCAVGGAARRAGDVLEVKGWCHPAVPQGLEAEGGFSSPSSPPDFARQEQRGFFCSPGDTVQSLVVCLWLSHLSLLESFLF